MFSLPGLSPVDLDFGKELLEFLEDGNGQKENAFGGFDLITILPAVFIELDIVEYHEGVTGSDFVKVAKPRKVVKLVRREDHPTTSVERTRLFV